MAGGRGNIDRVRLPLFALQLLFNPGALLVLMLLFVSSFPGDPLLLERVDTNTARPSSVGVGVLLLLCVLASAVWHRLAAGRWFAPGSASRFMLPANLLAPRDRLAQRVAAAWAARLAAALRALRPRATVRRSRA